MKCDGVCLLSFVSKPSPRARDRRLAVGWLLYGLEQGRAREGVPGMLTVTLGQKVGETRRWVGKGTEELERARGKWGSCMYDAAEAGTCQSLRDGTAS